MVIQVQEGEAGRAAESGGGADIELGARALVRPELVARRERAVEGRIRPIIDPCGL
jgi:hypothetical protein